MRIPLLLLFFIIMITGAHAEGVNNLTMDTDLGNVEQTRFNQITGYSFTEPGSAIISIYHKIPYNTIVTETYYLGNQTINTRFSCNNVFFAPAIVYCDFHIDSGDQNVTKTIYTLIPNPWGESILTSIGSTSDGKAGFGIVLSETIGNVEHYLLGRQIFEYTPDVAILVPALSVYPIQSVRGEATSKIDIEVQTELYSSYSRYQDEINANAETRSTSFYSIWSGLSSITGGITSFMMIFVDHPILIFAYLEIFALMYSMTAKNMWGWWKQYLEIHGLIGEFLIKNINFILITLGIVVALDILMRIVGALLGLNVI